MSVTLKITVHSASCHSLVEIYLVTVKLRTVNAGKFSLAANGKSATAAHSRAVYHYGVHRRHSLYSVFTGQITNELHHYQRTYRDDLVVFLATFYKRSQRVGNKTALSRASVVRHKLHYLADSLELVLKDNKILVSEANHSMHLNAKLGEFFSNGIRNSATNTAADYGNLLYALGFGSPSERTYEIRKTVALIHMRQLLGSSSYLLEDDRDRSRLAVIIRNRQRYSFTLRVGTQNYKLPRLCLFRDQRGIYIHQNNSWIKYLFSYYFVHTIHTPANIRQKTNLPYYFIKKLLVFQ